MNDIIDPRSDEHYSVALLRRRAKDVFLILSKIPAQDLSNILVWAARTIDRYERMERLTQRLFDAGVEFKAKTIDDFALDATNEIKSLNLKSHLSETQKQAAVQCIIVSAIRQYAMATDYGTVKRSEK